MYSNREAGARGPEDHGGARVGVVELGRHDVLDHRGSGPGSAEGGLKPVLFTESPRGARGNPPKHKGDRGDAFWRVSHYGNRAPGAHFHSNAIGSLNIRDSAPQINRAFLTDHTAFEHWPNKAQGQNLLLNSGQRRTSARIVL